MEEHIEYRPHHETPAGAPVTKKKKTAATTAEKKHLWNLFDMDICGKSGDADTDAAIIPGQTLTCVYGSAGNRETCDSCGFKLSYSEEGFLVCTNNKCAIIYTDIIDHSAEWRFYGIEDNSTTDPARCGMPVNPLLEESSYGCKILNGGKSNYLTKKIRQYTRWQSSSHSEQTRYNEFQYINDIAQIAGIPKLIIDCAMGIHKKILDNTSFRGENREGILGSSIYLSCRLNGYPRTIKEISTAFNLNVASVTKCCKIAMSIITSLETDLDASEKTNFGKTKPESFIERFCSKLNMNQELTKLCKFIAIKLDSSGSMPQNTPQSIASGIIYYVSQVFNLNLNKTNIHAVTEVSGVTINKCFNKIKALSEQTPFIPNALYAKYSIVAPAPRQEIPV